ncbi:hypothetical protein ACLOJK_037791 [Asimina triloba]
MATLAATGEAEQAVAATSEADQAMAATGIEEGRREDTGKIATEEEDDVIGENRQQMTSGNRNEDGMGKADEEQERDWGGGSRVGTSRWERGRQMRWRREREGSQAPGTGRQVGSREEKWRTFCVHMRMRWTKP